MLALHNLHIIHENTNDIFIDNGLILSAAPDAAGSKAVQHLHFDNCIAFPGLINSHDHLDFDLFPQLGNR
ncbi:MAG TPA: hypothetical protein VGE90_10535, partial [Chitinophaga sp.]